MLPGLHEGISGSIIGGYNLGICQYSNGEKKKAAIEAFKYITSREVQKKYVIENDIFSGIIDLYDDVEVCEIADCKFRKRVQSLGRPSSNLYDYDTYSKKFRNYIYEFLYGNKTAMEVLKRVEDITKVYYISLDTKNTSFGVISFGISLFMTILMILSLFFLFKNKFQPYFNFLSNDFWIVILLGLIIINNVSFFEFGNKTRLK